MNEPLLESQKPMEYVGIVKSVFEGLGGLSEAGLLMIIGTVCIIFLLKAWRGKSMSVKELIVGSNVKPFEDKLDALTKNISDHDAQADGRIARMESGIQKLGEQIDNRCDGIEQTLADHGVQIEELRKLASTHHTGIEQLNNKVSLHNIAIDRSIVFDEKRPWVEREEAFRAYCAAGGNGEMMSYWAKEVAKHDKSQKKAGESSAHIQND